MLAYVFWHERSTDANDGAAYQRDAAEFVRSLAASPLEGFAGARTFAIDQLPWSESDGPLFEDWYLLRGSADLDELNDAAVSGSRTPSHDRLAAKAAWGAGGLYRLRAGVAHDAHPIAQWFAKPPNMSYSEFDATVAAVRSPDRALWQRRMVLGPAPEFCLTGSHAVRLPPAFTSRTVERNLVAGITRTHLAPAPTGLRMRDRCMTCAKQLPWSAAAMICSYECTFCPDCASATDGVCPNCDGELTSRPKRTQ